jgi:hypothetical protein
MIYFQRKIMHIIIYHSRDQTREMYSILMQSVFFSVLLMKFLSIFIELVVYINKKTIFDIAQIYNHTFNGRFINMKTEKKTLCMSIEYISRV